MTKQPSIEQDGIIKEALSNAMFRVELENGHIITEIHIDLTGLKGAGNTARDVLGLDAGASYIGRYVVATYGVVYRIEMMCIEVPAGCGSLTDIDLEAEASGSLIKDGICSDEVLCATGGLAAGQMLVNNVPAIVANRYLYLTEGDTSGDDSVFTAGQYIIRFYGHALIT